MLARRGELCFFLAGCKPNAWYRHTFPLRAGGSAGSAEGAYAVIQHSRILHMHFIRARCVDRTVSPPHSLPITWQDEDDVLESLRGEIYAALPNRLSLHQGQSFGRFSNAYDGQKQDRLSHEPLAIGRKSGTSMRTPWHAPSQNRTCAKICVRASQSPI